MQLETIIKLISFSHIPPVNLIFPSRPLASQNNRGNKCSPYVVEFIVRALALKKYLV
jgi:hypothetical protein